MIKFKATKAEFALIKQIALRAQKMEESEILRDLNDWQMDITACHSNGNPLDLKKLLSADDFNFAHDVFGIQGHINRQTGKLTDFFSPRCSLPSKPKLETHKK